MIVATDGYNPGAMAQRYQLFWLRETGCDAGTPLRDDELEPELHAGENTGEDAGEEAPKTPAKTLPAKITLRLPYLDRREWSKRGEILAALPWERLGNVISPVLPARLALRNTTANLALADPLWLDQPPGSDPRHSKTWQRVSLAVQLQLRQGIAEEYFRDIARFADREGAYTMIMYQGARLFHGRTRGAFTYDLRDYPECRLTLALATKMTGRSIQNILERVELRLRTAGMPELARRYAPIWHQDLVAAVRKKPKEFISLLRAESAFIDALVELSLDRTTSGVEQFSKAASQALRKVYGMDVRHLGIKALESATEVLASRGDAAADAA